MIVYKDAISESNEELFSDAFPIKLVDDIVYEVDCAMVTIRAGEVDIGANPSAEEQNEGLEDGARTVNNIIHSFGLVPTLPFGDENDPKNKPQKAYLKYLKVYMKKVKEYLEKERPDEVEAFENGAKAYAPKLMAKFDDLEFYTGEKMDPKGMVALLNYREDGVTPFFTFWKHGLMEEKV